MEKDLERSVASEMPHDAEVSTTTIETGGLKRDLSSRHINMIAIAGMIVGSRAHTLNAYCDC
jgi:amino acid transporter